MTDNKINMADVNAMLANMPDFTAQSLLVSSERMASLVDARFANQREKILGMEVIVSDFIPADTFMLIDKNQLMPTKVKMPVSTVVPPDTISFRTIADFGLKVHMPSVVMCSYDFLAESPKDDWTFAYLFPHGKRGYVKRGSKCKRSFSGQATSVS